MDFREWALKAEREKISYILYPRSEAIDTAAKFKKAKLHTKLYFLIDEKNNSENIMFEHKNPHKR